MQKMIAQSRQPKLDKIVENNLALTHPDLCKEWHPTKNGNLTPYSLTCGSHKQVVWFINYYDENRKRTFYLEWPMSVRERVKQIEKGNVGCPYLSGQRVDKEFNSFGALYPDIAKEWHPSANGNLTPFEVTAGTAKSVFWLCSKGHKYDCSIYNRTKKGVGCPYCSGQKVIVGKTDLASRHPEIAKFWHPIKNGNLKPTDIHVGSNKQVWWLCSKGHEYQNKVYVRVTCNKNPCPYCSNRKVIRGENDLATTHKDLAKELHPTKNGNITPYNITASYSNSVVWIYPYDDPRTGKHFDFEWTAPVNVRVRENSGCPYLSNKLVQEGYNDLASYPQFSDLVAQFHPTKNGNKKPTNVYVFSEDKIWWLLPYDDPRTGKHFDFEWKSSVYSRTVDKLDCPYISHQAMWKGFNDLTSYPKLKHLITEWDYEANYPHRPEDFMRGAKYKAHWILQYDDPITGKHFDFKWQASICSRALNGVNCPFLKNKEVWPGYNDLASSEKYKHLLKEWDYSKNKLTPEKVMPGSHDKVYWICHKGHSYQAQVKKRTLAGHNCPICCNQLIVPGINDLASHPKYGYLAKEWHPTLNADLKPTMIPYGTTKKVYWQCPKGHTYKASVCNRARLGHGCRECAGSAIEKLAYDTLRKFNVDFEIEQSFKQIGRYRFDIYMKKYKMLIELDGEQHFKECSGAFKKLDSFEERKRRDNLKNTFALDNQIPILRIPYVYLPGRDKEKIETFIKSFLFTKQVPQEIIDFYSKHEFSNYPEVARKLNEMYAHVGRK